MDELHQPTKKKKSYGNRTNQRFRRRCRARGMNPNQIERLLKKRNATNKSRTFNKRKRDISIPNFGSQATTTMPKSISSISIHRQPIVKKMKKQNIPITTSTINENYPIFNKKYRKPMYLKGSIYILFRLLNQTSNCTFKKKSEQLFIRSRLNLFDQNYFFEAHLQLWKSYLTIGLEQHQWPEELVKMAKTNDFELCHQILINYIETVKEKLDYYTKKLSEQTAICSIPGILFEDLDQTLKDFVDRQRNYLLKRNNQILKKFKQNIQNNRTLQGISDYYPTVDQNQFIRQLMDVREKQTVIWEQQLILEMQVSCQFLPIYFNHVENLITCDTGLPLHNETKLIQMNNQCSKFIREAKRRMLDFFLSIYEMKLQAYEQQYQRILIDLKSLLIGNTSLQGELLFNQINQYMTNRINELKQNIVSKMPAYRGKLLRNRQRALVSSTQKTMTGVSPEPYLDLPSNPFDRREWYYLALGPSYIRVNQSAIRPKKQQEIEIKKEHDDIHGKVKKQLMEYPPYIPLGHPIHHNFSKELHDYLHQTYLTPLSCKDHIQAKEQADIFASIRKKIRQHHLTIRVTDKSNNFYIGSSIEFEKKAQAYFNQTNAYMQLTSNPYDDILKQVIQLLNQLRSKKLILQWQYNEMMPDPKQTELAHLYFNPKTHKDGVPVRPIVSTLRSATTKISKFLDSIIRPIFDEKCRQTTIIDGVSLIQDLHKYQRLNRLKSTTLFCTFDIHNLYTMLPQDESLNILVDFLHVHGYRKVKGVPLDTIRKLAWIVIKENVFVYNRKFYRQVIGGAMGSSFTLTLANIFMWKWQRELVRIQDITGEYFGRYIDDIFLTWNRSEHELHNLLNQANHWHPNIKLDYKISRSLPFLDVLVTNTNGILSSSVYHKPSAEPYVVPFLSDHHPHVFRNIIQTILTRAVRYSSSFEIFNRERRFIQLMLLYNGYPSAFINEQFERFFSDCTDASTFLPYIYNENQFKHIHGQLANQLTPRQSQVAQSAAQADLNNEQTDENNPMTSIQVHEPKQITTAKKSSAYSNKLLVHYTHEYRFRSFKRDIHHIHDHVLPPALSLNYRLMIGNRNRRSAKNELIHKKPKRSLLQNKAKKIRNKYMKLLHRRMQTTSTQSNNTT